MVRTRRPGTVNPRTGRTVARMPAAELFDAICEAAHACGDPGLVFLDTINRANPVPALGRIEATNPCGEVRLLPYGSCNLCSINLARLIADGRVDWNRLSEFVGVALRFLDDLIDVSRYPRKRYGSREGQVLSYAAPEPVPAQADAAFSGGCVGRTCEFCGDLKGVVPHGFGPVTCLPPHGTSDR